MKLDVNKLDWEGYEELPAKQKIKKKKKDVEDKKSKKSDNYKKRKSDEDI